METSTLLEIGCISRIPGPTKCRQRIHNGLSEIAAAFGAAPGTSAQAALGIQIVRPLRSG